MRNSKQGQSLIEILIGISLAALFIVGAAAIISPSIRSNKNVSLLQAKAELGSEMLNNVKSWSFGDWNSVLALATSSANPYYLSTATSSFSPIAGSESVTIASSSFVRYFYLSDIYRDAGGNATTSVSGSYDPSTKQVTVVIAPGAGSITPTSTYVMNINRSASNVFTQNDWTGGNGEDSALTVVSSTFASSVNLTTASSGQITLTLGGGACTL